MSKFVRRWESAPQERTDKTDKRTSVSFVSDIPSRLDRVEPRAAAHGMSFLPSSLHNNDEITSNGLDTVQTRQERTDKTDKSPSCPADMVFLPEKRSDKSDRSHALVSADTPRLDCEKSEISEKRSHPQSWYERNEIRFTPDHPLHPDFSGEQSQREVGARIHGMVHEILQFTRDERDEYRRLLNRDPVVDAVTTLERRALGFADEILTATRHAPKPEPDLEPGMRGRGHLLASLRSPEVQAHLDQTRVISQSAPNERIAS